MNVIQSVSQDGMSSGKAAKPMKLMKTAVAFRCSNGQLLTVMTLDDFSWTEPLSMVFFHFLPDLKTQASVVFPPRATCGVPAVKFCYFDGIAKFFFLDS